MDVKNKVKNILEENKKLKEELKMAKTKIKENDAGKDMQVTPPQLMTKSDGTALNTKGATADDLGKKYEENEADKDVQATPGQPAKVSDGDSGMKKDAADASADDLVKKYAAKKMEAAKEDEDTKKEATEPDADDVKKEAEPVIDKKIEADIPAKPDTDLTEKYKEMEGDMGKVVEIIEALKNEVDSLKTEVEALKTGGKSEEGNTGAQPEPPITEKASLRNAFVETMKVAGSKDKFGEIVKNVIY